MSQRLLAWFGRARRASSPLHTANAANNAYQQSLRLERWSATRDSAWALLSPHISRGTSVCIVGAGNGDDLPLARLAGAGARLTLLDIDEASLARAQKRVGDSHEVRLVTCDVTDGCADTVLRAASRGKNMPETLDLPIGPLVDNERFDVVIGDMIATQLLHAGLVALQLPHSRQVPIMRRFDEHFTRALVRRLHASVKPDGLVVHIHDTACWSATHEQPVSIEAALANPEQYVPILNRHDACDTVLHARALGATELTTEGVWWLWPLEPDKQFLVRAGVFAASLDES